MRRNQNETIEQERTKRKAIKERAAIDDWIKAKYDVARGYYKTGRKEKAALIEAEIRELIAKKKRLPK